MRVRPELSDVVSKLPAATPFTPPEALERQFGRKFLLRLGANESSFGPSPAALRAIEDSLLRIGHYSDGTCHNLRHALAHHLGCGIEHIVVGPGIDGLLGHLARIRLNPGDFAVTSLGSYPTLE